METPPSFRPRWILLAAAGVGLVLTVASPAAALGPSADRGGVRPVSICEFIPKWPGCPR